MGGNRRFRGGQLGRAMRARARVVGTRARADARDASRRTGWSRRGISETGNGTGNGDASRRCAGARAATWAMAGGTVSVRGCGSTYMRGRRPGDPSVEVIVVRHRARVSAASGVVGPAENANGQRVRFYARRQASAREVKRRGSFLRVLVFCREGCLSSIRNGGATSRRDSFIISVCPMMQAMGSPSLVEFPHVNPDEGDLLEF